jgi:hypothetical protein
MSSFHTDLASPSHPFLPRSPRPSRHLPGDRTEAGEGGLIPNGINTNPNELGGYPRIQRGGLLEFIFHTSRNVLGK